MSNNLSLLADFYEFTMSNGFFAKNMTNKIAYFDVFFRKVPDNGGYVVFAGLEQVIDLKLPYHIAVKKATYIDEFGKLIVPEEPNAYKFETFIFDSFEMLEDVLVLRVKREEEFAPVKNAKGEDSPETARKLYNAYHQK